MTTTYKTTGTSAADFLPRQRTLSALARAAADCRGCPLYRHATQAVFGEGPTTATLMLVGEQPGDREDVEGHPFVGPAGRLLDELLAEAAIDRSEVYVTNAVKHFKWVARGKRRLHAKPSSRELAACRPWLEAEIEAIEPSLIFCLGATAAQQLLGSAFRLTHEFGKLQHSAEGLPVMASYHPSAILRAPDDSRQTMRRQLLADLKRARKLIHKR
jgi:uracil-DNA glycosylase family protein